jgi:hypothetical protein
MATYSLNSSNAEINELDNRKSDNKLHASSDAFDPGSTTTNTIVFLIISSHKGKPIEYTIPNHHPIHPTI